MSQTEPVSMPGAGEPPLLTGREIAGRYRIGAKLGEGGMGAVYKAEQISLKRTVAIKLLRPDVSSSPMLLRRFNAEAEAVAKLRHPNTVSIYDFGQDTDGTLFIAMEYIEGRSLRSLIHHEAPLSFRRALSIASQVAASLADAHSRTIIHRDLKPDNVMLTDRGRSKDNVTVLDFGIAKLRDDSRATQQMTQAGDMLGTPQYMAPEQIRAEAIDGRTDIYALGCMLYEMITARLPFEAPTIMALLSKHLVDVAPPPSLRRPELGVPPALDELVMTAMAKDPAARPATMEEYGERIAALLAQMPAEATVQRSALVGVPTSQSPIAHADTPAAPSALGGFAPTPLQPPPLQPPPLAPPSYPPPATHPVAAAATPYPGPPPYGGHYPAQPTPPQQPAPMPAPYPGPPPHAPAGSSKLMWVLVAVLLLGGGGAGVYFATRGKGTTGKDAVTEPTREERHDASIVGPDKPVQPDKPDDSDGDVADDGDEKLDTSDDPWAGVTGTTIDVGHGVKLVVPPGMKVQQNKDNVVVGDQQYAIIAATIPEETNDPDVFANAYAKQLGLTRSGVEEETIAGARRKVYAFTGKINGMSVAHIAVPLFGPNYRVAVVVHILLDGDQIDPKHLATTLDVLSRRIKVPPSLRH